MKSGIGFIFVLVGGVCIVGAALFSILLLFPWAFFHVLLRYSWQEIVRSNPELDGMTSSIVLALAVGLPSFVVGIFLVRKPQPVKKAGQGEGADVAIAENYKKHWWKFAIFGAVTGLVMGVVD